MENVDWLAVEELSTSFQIEREESNRDNSIIRISGIGDCKRKIGYRTRWYLEGRKEPPIWSHGLSIFDTGHKLHLGLQHRLSNAGALKWVDADPVVKDGEFAFAGNFELPLIDREYRIRGTLDCLTRPLKRRQVEQNGVLLEVLEPTEVGDPEGKRYIIDIKTITARERYAENWRGQMELYKSPFEKLTEAKAEHVNQASLYSWMVTRPDFRADRLPGPLPEMPDIMILYVAKDLDPRFYEKYPDYYPDPKGLLNSPFKIFTVPASQQRVNTLLRKVTSVWEYLDRGELPPRDYNHTPHRVAWACVDCPFREVCYAEEGYFQGTIPEEPARLQYRKEQLPQAAPNPQLTLW